MIPKVIHYCWFGKNPLPNMAIKCIESWKKYCPDYVIKEWNEDTFDIESVTYVKQAYENRKWAFVSDYVRLYALVNEGGIYMDTDVELIKSLDMFLDLEAFSGFESTGNIPTGLMAAERGQSLFEEFLHDYDKECFINEDGTLEMTTNVQRITKTCLKYNLKLDNSLQTINGFTLYPMDYFCPKDAVTKKLTITNNTVAIHHFDGSWMPNDRKFVSRFTEIFGFKATRIAIRIKHFIKRSK